jgi:hypothetical protein
MGDVNQQVQTQNIQTISQKYNIDPNKPIPPELLSQISKDIAAQPSASTSYVQMQAQQAQQAQQVQAAIQALADREKAGTQTANDKLLAAQGLAPDGKTKLEGGGSLNSAGQPISTTAPVGAAIVVTTSPPTSSTWFNTTSPIGIPNWALLAICVVLLLLSSGGMMFMMMAMN